jgi:F-type H+-transporting ATPase subunit gamma
MANLKDIRKRRKGATNTKKITRTMELVSSAKLRKAQDAAVAARPYAEELRELVLRIAERGGKNISHPLLKERQVKNVLIAVATSDRGLCGAFNANLVNTALKLAKEQEALGRKVRFVALSKKAASGIAFAGYPVEQAHSKLVGGNLKYDQTEKMANAVIQDFVDGKSDLVYVVFSRFFSPNRQQPTASAMLPAGYASDKSGTTDAVGTATAARRAIQGEFIYEPESNELFAILIPQMVRFFLFSALLQTTASEHAARRIAMKNATDAASDMIKALTTAYNRGRQGKITQEIAEITGAVEAMA